MDLFLFFYKNVAEMLETFPRSPQLHGKNNRRPLKKNLIMNYHLLFKYLNDEFPLRLFSVKK